jgi:two-component system chemotaxis sensor kinase CheA
MANQENQFKARLLATFRVEAQEHLEAITANLLALERELPPAEVEQMVEVTFRQMHTLKGAARSVGQLDVESLCQACESVLSRVTRSELVLTPSILGRLQEAVDTVTALLAGHGDPSALGELIGRLERAAAEAGDSRQGSEVAALEPTSIAQSSLTGPPVDTIRLATAKLDTVLLQAEDLLVPKLAAAERVGEARGIVEALGRCRAVLHQVRAARRRSSVNGSDRDPPTELDSELRAVVAQAEDLLHHLALDQRTIGRVVDSLHDELRRIRLTPASTILDLFPRMVRDLTRQHGKDVEWVMDGADLDVDRRVLEAMKEPLIHLVRNAIDHGIEPPKARAQAGKAPRGQVAVTVASLEGGRIEIGVEDDGGGIDLARVKAAAVRVRLLTAEEADSLTDDQALDLIFRSGLSTSPIISDLSGHGLGLAIVKERVERLGGEIRVKTGTGAGTSVRMVLPATIATFRGLVVQAGGQSFLLPTEAVERAVRVASEAIESVEGREVIRWNGHPLFIARLSRLLGLLEVTDRPEPASKQPCVIVKSGDEQVGLLVEDILGDREVLVKEIGPPLVRVKYVAAAGLLGTGQVVLILRPADLLRSVREIPRPAAGPTGEYPAAPEEKRRQPLLLVVDDSITTRTMEKNLLEAAGYQVRVAVDGVDAWTLLRSEEFDLVVSDVDMPRMDGFDLTARIRADRTLADLPVVLVTALESREHKERGIEAGANAYVVKSSFDQSNLLEIIRRLV